MLKDLAHWPRLSLATSHEQISRSALNLSSIHQNIERAEQLQQLRKLEVQAEHSRKAPETFIVNQRDDRHDPNETLDRRHLTIDRKGGLPATR
jgi:hypothetical protein